VLATGYIGVDIFFALSGFLITTLLYEEWERTGDISLRRFYERRARRLLPALWLLVAAFAIVMIAVHPFAAQWPLGRLALTTLLFANNWVTALVPAHGRVLGALVPTWSLAQEAQFYLLWPLALWALLRHGARPGAVLGLLGLAIAALLATVPLVRHAYPSYNPYINPLDRGAELLLGCAAAIAWRTRLVPAALRSRTAGWALAGGLVVVLGHSGGVPEEWIYLSAAVLATLLITNLLTGPRRSPAFAALRWVGLPDQGLLAGIFCAAPLRYTGKVSYGLYLYHLPIYYLFWHYLPGRSPYFYAPIVLGLSFAAAAGSWWMIERPAIIHHRAAQARGRPRHRSAARHRWRAALRSAIRVPAHGDPVRERRPSALGLSTEARR
jgi:peptidoglycan/LPS O-acetylase OafA/YrhL